MAALYQRKTHCAIVNNQVCLMIFLEMNKITTKDTKS